MTDDIPERKLKVKPCPAKCKFDWVKFHRDMDIAVAHMLEENNNFLDLVLPSNTSIMDFLRYTFKKRNFQLKLRKMN